MTQLVGVKIEMTGGEARDLYAELYRISADKLLASYHEAGFDCLANLMAELGGVGADE